MLATIEVVFVVVEMMMGVVVVLVVCSDGAEAEKRWWR